MRTLLTLADEIGDRARSELDASEVTVDRSDAVAEEWVTITNIWCLGAGERRFPADEMYPRSRYPGVTSMLERGEGCLAVQHAPDCLPEIARVLALFGRSSCVGAPLTAGDGTLWGELYATRDYGRPTFGRHELAVATAPAAEAGPLLAAQLLAS